MKGIILGIFLLLLSSVVVAVPVTGVFNMTGSIVSVDYTSDFVDFTPSATNFTVTPLITGDFVSIFSGGEVGVIKDFYYNGDSDGLVDLFKVVGTGPTNVSFNLISVNSFFETPIGFLLEAVGTLYVDGYDATVGIWRFSTQGGVAGVSWSATTTSVSAPETLALLGFGLMGVAAARRRKAS